MTLTEKQIQDEINESLKVISNTWQKVVGLNTQQTSLMKIINDRKQKLMIQRVQLEELRKMNVQEETG